MSEKIRLLAVHDIHVPTPDGTIGWAYWRRTQALKKYAPADFEVTTCMTPEIKFDIEWLKQFDIVFNLEYAAPQYLKFKDVRPDLPVVVSYNSDKRRRREYWARAYSQCDFMICNNVEVYEDRDRMDKTCCISNGVDIDTFRCDIPIEDREHRGIFAGSTGPTKGKGWAEVFDPLEAMMPAEGFVPDFRPVDDIKPQFVFPTERTVEWYNSASYCLIASLSEGTPNLLTEAVACGCVAVSVPVGNILEWGEDRENCVLVHERTPEAFMDALRYAREHRERLSEAGRDTIRRNWSYGFPGFRADYYFQLFRRIVESGADNVKPFRYDEIFPWDI